MTRSVIEQELIDGVLYWDTIGANWYRLIERKTMDVIGHYKAENNGFGKHYAATRREWLTVKPECKRLYNPDAESKARAWIEAAAAEGLTAMGVKK